MSPSCAVSLVWLVRRGHQLYHINGIISQKSEFTIFKTTFKIEVYIHIYRPNIPFAEAVSV